jgi:acyl-CoA thioesterase I
LAAIQRALGKESRVNHSTLRKILYVVTAITWMVTTGLYAQNSGDTAAQPVPQRLPSGHPNTPYWVEHDAQLEVDFGGLDRFKQANEQLPAPAPGENRVVFMGDSITQGWKLDESFPGKPYINRGIGGQTSPQMLVRFRQDVVDLKPKVVVILAGTNDLAGNTGPMTLQQTEDNLASMSEIAHANGIRVVLCSVLPAYDFAWAPGLQPAIRIFQLNAWIKDYAEQKGYIYIDYYSALKDDRGGLPAALSTDGVHPLPAGYAMMAPLAEAGIEKALKQRLPLNTIPPKRRNEDSN